MRFIFLSIKGDARNYVTEKLMAAKRFRASEQSLLHAPSATTIDNALAQQKNERPALATSGDFFEVNRRQRAIVEAAQRCAVQELVETAPLIAGEEIEEDFFSYLLQPFHEVPAFTAVMLRRTNMSEILYIFEMVQIDFGSLIHLLPPTPEVPVTERAMLGWSFSITSDMIKKMLKNAAGKAVGAGLSKLGAVVLNIVMKELFGVDDTQRMIDEMRRVVKEEIEANELSKIDGTIDGTLQYLTIEYKNEKASLDLSVVRNRERLLASLKTYSARFYTDVIGTLRQEKYARRGLRTFMMAAPVHLLITQEMALVDPEFMNPNQSSFLLTLRQNATLYKNHVANVYANAMSDRNRMEVYSKDFTDCMGSSCVHKTTWWWRDNYSGQTAGEFMGTKEPPKSARDVASESLERHRSEVLSKLREDLGNPQETFLNGITDLENFTFPSA